MAPTTPSRARNARDATDTVAIMVRSGIAIAIATGSAAPIANEAASDIAPATRPDTPAIRMLRCEPCALATPIIKDEVERTPSFDSTITQRSCRNLFDSS